MQVMVEIGTRFSALTNPDGALGRRFIDQLVAGIDATCRRLGVTVAGPPDVHPTAGDEVVRVRLGGQVHRCPEVVARAVSDHFLRQEPGPDAVSDWPEEVAGCLDSGDSTVAFAAADTVVAIAVQIVEGAAAELVDFEQAQQFADAARAADIGPSLSLADLGTLLKTPASLGVAISDRSRVMKIITEAVACDLADADVAEVVTARLRSRRIRIEANPGYFEHIAGLLLDDAIAVHDPAAPSTLRDPFDLMADGLFYDLGLRIPEIQLAANEDLTGNQLRIIVGDAAPSLRIGLAPEQLLVSAPVEALAKFELAATATANPVNGRRCAIISAADGDATASYTTWDPVGYLALVTAAELRRHAHHMVDVDSVERELAALHKVFPTLVLTVLERITVGHLVRVLRLLLRDQIGIRNLRLILESLLAADLLDAARPPDCASDAEHGAAVVRAAMSRYLAHKFMQSRVYILDTELRHELETLIANERAGSNANENDLEARRELIRAAVCTALDVPGERPPVILTSGATRYRLSRLLADQRPDLAVLRYEELPATANTVPPATIWPISTGPTESGPEATATESLFCVH